MGGKALMTSGEGQLFVKAVPPTRCVILSFQCVCFWILMSPCPQIWSEIVFVLWVDIKSKKMGSKHRAEGRLSWLGKHRRIVKGKRGIVEEKRWEIRNTDLPENENPNIIHLMWLSGSGICGGKACQKCCKNIIAYS